MAVLNLILDFVKQYFDKLLLTLLLFVFVGVILHLVHHDATGKAVDWALQTFSAILGGLLGLITGAAMASAKKVE